MSSETKKDPSGIAQVLLDEIERVRKTGQLVPGLLSPDDVNTRRLEYVKNIFESFELLGRILDRHESTIHKRWLKKTKDQRRKIIATAWGTDMAASRCPDFDAAVKEPPDRFYRPTDYREAYLWPYINEEALTQPRTLLLFLAAPARHPPSVFATADHAAMHIGLHSRAIIPDLLISHVMIFKARTNPGSYGELFYFYEHPNAIGAWESGKGLQAGEGLLLMKAQERVLSFLVKVAKCILHDMSENSLLRGPVTAGPASNLDADFASLESMAAEAPYRPPATLDFGRITHIIAGRRDEAADHLLLLREDPGYFESCAFEWKDHCAEIINDALNRPSPCSHPEWASKLWGGSAIRNNLHYAYIQIEIYSELQAQAEKLRAMQELYAGSLDLESNLPAPYLDAIIRFLFYLYQQAADAPVRFLKSGFPASPPVRALYESMYKFGENGEMSMFVSQRPGYESTRHQDRLHGIIFNLDDPWARQRYGFTRLVNELQRLTHSEPSAKAMISPYIASMIGDLAIVCGYIHQLEIYQPWATSFDALLREREGTLIAEYSVSAKFWTGMMDAIAFDEATLARLGSPVDNKFNYPVEKRRNKENVEALRRAEENLDGFWRNIDQLMESKGGDLEHTFVHRLLAQPRTLQRTPPWIEPETNQPLLEVETRYVPISQVDYELQRRTEQTLTPENATTRPSVRTKTKTRPMGRPTDHAADAQTNASTDQSDRQLDIPALQPQFVVDKRAPRVFNTLFFNPSVKAAPGEVAWPEFLHAMSSAGFAPEKLYGSVWQFSPTEKLDLERSIQFHEPHPDGKIPYRTARRHGRRLERAYGWQGRPESKIRGWWPIRSHRRSGHRCETNFPVSQ